MNQQLSCRCSKSTAAIAWARATAGGLELNWVLSWRRGDVLMWVTC